MKKMTRGEARTVLRDELVERLTRQAFNDSDFLKDVISYGFSGVFHTADDLLVARVREECPEPRPLVAHALTMLGANDWLVAMWMGVDPANYVDGDGVFMAANPHQDEFIDSLRNMWFAQVGLKE